MGTDYREIKEISKQLNIPMDAAQRLHKRVTDNSKAAGGLMSRK
jgi:hypothetical protein